MDSKYAYARFTKPIHETEMTTDGRLVQFNRPCSEGETNLMSVSQFDVLKKDFSDCFEGKVIKQDNLVNVINLLYERLMEDVARLPEVDSYTQSRIDGLKEFERDGILRPDHNTESSINDLANKFFVLQEQVRELQRSSSVSKKHIA